MTTPAEDSFGAGVNLYCPRVVGEHPYKDPCVLLGLVGSRGGRAAARYAVFVHRLDVGHVAEADGRTGGEDVPVQAGSIEEERIEQAVICGDAAATGVVPTGRRGVSRVEGEVVIYKLGRAGIEARLSASPSTYAEVVIVV